VIPDELEPPELLLGIGVWFDAFFDLSTDRQLGMVAGPIPDASIRRYTAGWPDDDVEAFRTCMRRMDAEFLAKRDDEPQPEAQASSNPARDAFRGTFKR
jgi:hypothetical protein